MSSSHKATLLDGASNALKTSVELASEKGASNWLTVLPLQEHNFTLHKTAFHDAVALRYGWDPVRLPQYCACGKKFSVEHAFTCPKGGFPSIRHNEIRDLTAGLLTEVCHEVVVESHLYNQSQVRSSSSPLPTLKMALVLTFQQMVFGEVAVRKPILT